MKNKKTMFVAAVSLGLLVAMLLLALPKSNAKAQTSSTTPATEKQADNSGMASDPIYLLEL